VAEPEPPGELVAEDLAVLGILSQEGRLPEARTAGTLAISLEKTPAEVRGSSPSSPPPTLRRATSARSAAPSGAPHSRV
jgi:hypothetical protein